MSLNILIADDEEILRKGIIQQLKNRDFLITEAKDGLEAWNLIKNTNYDLVLLDVRMPGLSGLDVLKNIKEHKSSTTVAIITAQANVKDAVSAIHDGAFDYIEKPLAPGKLEELIDRAIEARSLVEEIAFSRPAEAPNSDAMNTDPKEDFVGHSEPMKKIFSLIDKLAKVNTSVLIRGENGTGKELVAKAIHFNSPRKSKPFLAVNCGAIPAELMESEFFGHEKGAFTGAQQRKIGKFQYASGGTLFLDEIGDLPLPMQVKLLRVLQEQKITPVGSNRELKVDVRIIAATNKNLEELIEGNLFRNDLFYRLNVMPVFLPPLKKRIEDLPSLIEHFISKFNIKHQRAILGVHPQALEKLKAYNWPGNIREFENAMEHAFVLESSSILKYENFPEHIREAVLDREEGWELPVMPPQKLSIDGPTAEVKLSLDYNQDKERFEREFIVQALKSNKGKINQTCENAKIPKNTLLRKIKKYGITAKDYE